MIRLTLLFSLIVFCSFGFSQEQKKIIQHKKQISPRLSRVEVDGRFGCIDEDGNEVVPIKYNYIGKFVGGRAKVKVDSYFGYIDEHGNEIIPPKYHYIGKYNGGIAKVYVLYYPESIIDNGSEIMHPKYADEKNNDEKVVESVKLFGLIDEKGNELVAPKYHQIGQFKQGRAKVMLNNLYGFINTDGDEIAPP